MRLIDADFTCKGCIRYRTSLSCEECVVNDAPTVDAVPVVRCEKCEHWVKNDDGQCVCALFDIANSYGEPVVTKPDNFCSYGKRKGCAD